MCSISGVLVFGRPNEDRLRAIEDKLRSIIIRAEERGRDSWGIVWLREDGTFGMVKAVGRASEGLPKVPRIFDSPIIAAIANNRAEPTTEYVKEKGPEDIQPFVGSYIAATHNGVIANDYAIEAKYGLKKPSIVDSSILPPLLEKIWDGTLEGLRKILAKEVVGSFALAIIDRRAPGKLWLATNFKPLYVMWDRGLNALFFSSLDTYLEDPNKPPWEANVVKRIEPYSVVEVSTDGGWRRLSLFDEEPNRRRKVLVVASGGLDSTTAATSLIKQGYDVTLLHFNYGHVAEGPEDRAIREISKFLKVPLIEVNMDFFKIVRHSPLLGDGEINRVRSGINGAEFAHEWVPARNLIFIALAVAIAEAMGYDYVATGINLEEAGAYPDNEMEFIRLLNQALPYAVGPNRHVELIMPVGNLMKHEIVKLGLKVGAPLHLTWSCYDKGPKHCGRCGPCYMRRIAFKVNGVRDPVEYDLPEEEEEEFWKGTKPYRVPTPPS